MRNIIFSLAIIAMVASVVIGGTTAFFSDSETSSGNVFAAGAIDLQIDNTSYGFDYNDPTNEDPVGDWGLNESNSWELTDLDGELFFNFSDLKPGDYGEDTISLHVDDNDAWACMAFDLAGTPEHGLTEPEAEVDGTDGDDEGELQNYLSFLFWWDDGDNVLEEGEDVIPSLSGLPGEVFTGAQLAIADSTTEDGPLEGGTTHYIGKGWCFGEITATPAAPADNPDGPTPGNTGFTCNGAGDHNDAQTDGIEVDVVFSAEQSRNNPNFVCEGGEDGIGCQEEADVMLVLDSSGSIDNGGDPDSELNTLKDAANSFVTALGPSADGVRIGLVDFDDDAELLLPLSSSEANLINEINNNIQSGGNTNLEDGIRTAQQELDDNGRSGVPDIMVIITDGQPTAQDGNDDSTGGTDEDEAQDAADDAKGAGTEIFAVGVGDGVDDTYLQDRIVSAPSSEHYFGSDFSELETTLEELTTCPDDGGGGGDQRESVGASLTSYQSPQSCTLTVDDDGGGAEDHTTIQGAVDAASSGETICVEDGTYDETVSIGTADLSLRGVNPPTNTAVINGGVEVNASDVTVSGFSIVPGTTLGEVAGVYLREAADNATISFNDIDGSTASGNPRGVIVESGIDLQGVTIDNNVIHDNTTGIFLNPHTGSVAITNNDIDDNTAGIGGLNGASVTNNEFESTSGSAEAIGVDGSFDTNPATVNFNNFLDGTMLNTYAGLTGTVDAENNFWGPSGGAVQTDDSSGGTVDFDPEASPQFTHN